MAFGQYAGVIYRLILSTAIKVSVIAKQNTLFVTTAQQSVEQDQSRRGGETIRALPVHDRLPQALQVLQEDKLYRKEYEQFVLAMLHAEGGCKNLNLGQNTLCCASSL